MSLKLIEQVCHNFRVFALSLTNQLLMVSTCITEDDTSSELVKGFSEEVLGEFLAEQLLLLGLEFLFYDDLREL